MLHTFVALVQDKPGVLTRVASLFRRLNINIVSLTVGESERPDTSRMTIVCDAHEHAAHRIRASLYKLETTVRRRRGRPRRSRHPRALPHQGRRRPQPAARRQHSRSQIFELANVFRARVVDLAPESIMLEMTGAASKIEGLLQVLREPATKSSRSRAPAAWPCDAATTPAASSKPSAAKPTNHTSVLLTPTSSHTTKLSPPNSTRPENHRTST